MAKLKIISNPYIDKISFYKFSDNGWIEISHRDKSEENNKLLEERIVKGFFPFVVQDIIDIIVNDYGSDTEIEFEGTKDAYFDLVEVCKEHKNIMLTQSALYLNNAQDVLGEISNIYNEAKELIEKSVLDKKEIDEDTNRFLEATSSIIPLCVIGNYSSGKSSFINALIGTDILPCGDDPVTANVYKISKSEYNSVAKIRFKKDECQFEIIFDGNTHSIKQNNQNNPLIYQVDDELKQIEKEPLYIKLHKALDILNTNSEDILNIEIEVPFANGLLEESTKDFVIFDTPGSDPATYQQHIKVLQNQLECLSNGLILFVATDDRLDSKGNEKLYNMLKSIKELDSRFTMIIVNKADGASFPEKGYFTDEEISKKKNLTIPRNLYSNGIYFVSSILGLGSKNEGEFISSHNAELYDTNREKYSNPENKWYKQLYKYDIMPAQIKKRMVVDAEDYGNKAFVNSGLFAVEHEILSFADKYSSYNKCHQSQLFLENVMNITKIKIEERREQVAEQKRALINEMEREKKELCKIINNKREKYKSCFDDEYKTQISELINVVQNDAYYDVSIMTKIEKEIRDSFANELKLQELREKNKQLNNKAKENVKEKIEDVKKDIKNIGGLVSSFGEQISTIGKNIWAERELAREIDNRTSNELFKKVSGEFDLKAEESKNNIYNKSKEFYDSKSNEVKNKFLELVDVTEALTNDQKNILKNIIVSYESIKFDTKADDIFIEKDLKVKILFITINKYDSNKLSKVFNENISEGINNISAKISESHKQSYIKWLYHLTQALESNIAKFNPALLKKAEDIEKKNKEIKSLENDQDTLAHYLVELKNLIDWKN